MTDSSAKIAARALTIEPAVLDADWYPRRRGNQASSGGPSPPNAQGGTALQVPQ